MVEIHGIEAWLKMVEFKDFPFPKTGGVTTRSFESSEIRTGTKKILSCSTYITTLPKIGILTKTKL